MWYSRGQDSADSCVPIVYTVNESIYQTNTQPETRARKKPSMVTQAHYSFWLSVSIVLVKYMNMISCTNQCFYMNNGLNYNVLCVMWKISLIVITNRESSDFAVAPQLYRALWPIISQDYMSCFNSLFKSCSFSSLSLVSSMLFSTAAVWEFW